MILPFILLVVGRIPDLEYFTGKDIRIYLSTANHIFLAKDTLDGHILPRSKYSDLDDIVTAFRLHKDGQEYRLLSGEDVLCAELGTVGKCERTKTWTIVPKTIGYTIAQDGKCITMVSRTRIGVSRCTDSEDQLFDFKFVGEDQACEEERNAKPKQEPKTIVINVTTSAPAEKNVKVDSGSSAHLLHHNNDDSGHHGIGHCSGLHHLSKLLNGSRGRKTTQGVVYL